MTSFESIGVTLPHFNQPNIRVLCPRCGEQHHSRKKTLSCDTERGLFHCFRCGWKGRITGKIGWTDYQPDPEPIETRRRKRQFAIDCVMRESMPISAEPAVVARHYLINRLGAIPDPFPVLRYHPALRYYRDGKNQGGHPVLIGEVRDITGQLVTLHRTYLTEDGRKAPVESSKKIMAIPHGSCSGAAIRLYPASEAIVIAEGIETALALSMKLNRPAWAAISAHGMENILLPDIVRAVHIGADNDKSGRGQEAAERLGRRLAMKGIPVWIHTPEKVGTDWADIRMAS